jgi:hypothetical protein
MFVEMKILMKKNTRIYISLALIGFFIILLILTFRPIINPKPKQCAIVSGVVEQIWSCEETHDINIRLEGYNKTFYINRGLDSELRTFKLKELVGKPVKIYAVKHWTPLDPKQKIQHVACVVTDRDTLYTEF